jgi:preprotein translocase subunit YajC
MNELFSNIAFAADDATPKTSDTPGIESLFVQLLIIFVIFYFILIRPQQKKAKELATLQKQLKKGDKVITISGVYGTVAKSTESDKFAEVEIADNVVIKILKTSISEIENKAEKKTLEKEKTKSKKDSK